MVVLFPRFVSLVRVHDKFTISSANLLFSLFVRTFLIGIIRETSPFLLSVIHSYASSFYLSFSWISNLQSWSVQVRGRIIKSIYNLVFNCLPCNSSHNVVNLAIGIMEAFSNVNILAKLLAKLQRSRALVGALTMVLVVL